MIELYEEMNEKIADIITIGGTNADLYASAYIKQLRAENARLKAESADKERAYNEEYNLRKDLQREYSKILTELYKVANESIDKTITLTAEDIKLIAKRYGVKIGEEQ